MDKDNVLNALRQIQHGCTGCKECPFAIKVEYNEKYIYKCELVNIVGTLPGSWKIPEPQSPDQRILDKYNRLPQYWKSYIEGLMDGFIGLNKPRDSETA